MIVAITSANRDESHFTHAAELDLLRSIDRHLAFGYGIDTCLGAPLARLACLTRLARLARWLAPLG